MTDVPDEEGPGTKLLEIANELKKAKAETAHGDTDDDEDEEGGDADDGGDD